MNNDEIIRMAREAGFTNPKKFTTTDANLQGILSDFWENLERFAALVAAAERERLETQFKKMEALMQIREQQPNKPCCLEEREACAKICEETTAAWTQHLYNSGCVDCAAAIRARGNT